MRPTRRSHLVHPLPSRTNNVGQTMQFGDNYLNDGHLQPEIPQIDGRDSFNSVSHWSLAVRPLKCPTGRPLRSCAAVVTSRVTCVWWQVRRRHQMTVVPACDSTRGGRHADGHGGGRDVRTADAASACGRRSARILEICGLTQTTRSRKFTDADRRGSLTQARHSAS